jgi:hypothetical protein
MASTKDLYQSHWPLHRVMGHSKYVSVPSHNKISPFTCLQTLCLCFVYTMTATRIFRLFVMFFLSHSHSYRRRIVVPKNVSIFDTKERTPRLERDMHSHAVTCVCSRSSNSICVI